MWIKLISPKSTERSMDSGFKTHMAPPLSLLVLGALTPARHRVTLADENVERLDLDDRPDLVGITVKVDSADRAYAISSRYRRKGVPVVMGGIHPTVCPEHSRPHADAVVVGEAETTWPQLVADAEASALKPLYRAPGPTDPAAMPIPRWELMKGKNYLFTNTLCISRGCPWRCDFCYSASENLPRGHRMKPVDRILAEIDSLATNHIFFIDDNFIGDPKGARRLLRALARRNLTWHTAVSADIGRHDDILDLMAGSGCRSLFIGFETLAQANLRSCGKGQNRVDDYECTVRKIHDRRMMVNASIVVGFDGDTPDVFRDTVGWLTRMKAETMTAHILTPLPGTPFYRRLLDEGRIIDHDLTHYNTSQAVFRPRGMSPEELENGLHWMYREFYSWSGIRKRLPDAREQWTAYLLFNVLYRKLGRSVSLLGRAGWMGNLARLAKTLSYPERRAEALASAGAEVRSGLRAETRTNPLTACIDSAGSVRRS